MKKNLLIRSLVLLAIPLVAVAAAQETTPISALEVKYRNQIFENDRFAAYLLEIPPKHASLMHRHATEILTVFVSGGETIGTIYGKPPKEDRFAAGEVRFRPVGFTHSTENVGTNPFRCVILEFKSSIGSIESARPDNLYYCNSESTTACVNEKYLICTPQLYARELKIAPDAIWRNQGSAHDQMLIAVSDFELSDKSEGKPVNMLKRKSGEVAYLPGGSSHQWQNATNEAVHIVAVEFRQ